jgi:hypothetical protein
MVLTRNKSTQNSMQMNGVDWIFDIRSLCFETLKEKAPKTPKQPTQSDLKNMNVSYMRI